MDFKIGDRVRSLVDDHDGLEMGELGTVINIDSYIPVIRWDEFNPVRHNEGGLTEDGHGWYIFGLDEIELVNDIEDLGDIPEADVSSVDVLLGV